MIRMLQPNAQSDPQGRASAAGEDGVVLLSVLMLLAVVTLVGASSITTMLMDLRMSGYYSKRVLVFYIAEAGVNRGRYEVSNGDGDKDFSTILAPTLLFQSEALNGGSYTVVATPVAGPILPRLTIRSTGCYPSLDPCPRMHASSVVEVLLELNAEATEPEDRVRLVAWKEIY